MPKRLQILDNVWLTAVQCDKFKTGCFSVNVLRPLRREEAAVNALIPSILLGGTQQHPDIRSISIRLDELFGASVGTLVRKKGEAQAFGLYADFVEDSLAGEPVFSPLASFLSELLFSPVMNEGAFSRSIFDMERENLIRAMRAAGNNKQSYANLQMLKTMFAGEPYGIPYQGEEADLEGVTPASVWRQYRQALAASRIELFYLGKADADTAVSVFQSMLKALPRESVTALPTVTRHAAGELRRLTESMPLEQSKLSIGCRARPASDAKTLAQMLVFTVLYGGGSGSLLFTKVREELSLCYYANALYDKYKGVLRINAGIAQENEQAAKQEIYRQLENCQKGRFTSQELAIAKRMLAAQLRSDLDSPARLDEFYLGQAILGETFELPALIEAVEQVSAEQVVEAASCVCPDTEFFLKGVSL